MTEKLTVGVLGSGGVGKSCLTIQFIANKFNNTYDPTIVDSYTKQVEYMDKFYTLDILDTAGQEEFKTTRDLYIQQGNAFIIVYSIDDDASFFEAQGLFQDIAQATDRDEFPVVLVGNKCDMEENRLVTTQQGKDLASKYRNCTFIEASAKSNINVELAFHSAIAGWIKEKNGELVEELSSSVKKTDGPVMKEKKGLFTSISGDKNQVEDDLAVVKGSK